MTRFSVGTIERKSMIWHKRLKWHKWLGKAYIRSFHLQFHYTAVSFFLSLIVSPFCLSLGCTFIGAIMDGYGRKRLTALSVLLTGVFGVITAFVDGVIPFLAMRIICGACTLVR